MQGKIHRNSLKLNYELLWYQIKDILGQGGFGITYLARDTNLDIDVAIKEYLPIELAVREIDSSVHPVTEDRSTQFSWGLERFITEARTLARLKHPNIVSVFSVFEKNNTGYMVMAYEKGESLHKKIQGKKTLSETELLNIIPQILDGLRYIHAKGFIHRDIKPDNIIISDNSIPILIDFGSARQSLGEKTKTITAVVSPCYSPFEQYVSQKLKQGPWTDVYGLAATLYRACVGVPPSDAMNRSEGILQSGKDSLLFQL